MDRSTLTELTRAADRPEGKVYGHSPGMDALPEIRAFNALTKAKVDALERPTHSPLGASSAERWMNCPGSVTLIQELKLPETDEPSYRIEGTAAHEAAAKCLTTEADAWEVIGETFSTVEFTADMATAVQVYLDEVRPLASAPGAQAFYEYGISSSDHPLFYGTVDCAIVVGSGLFVRDYKHGEGVVVEVADNPQVMYYAYGFLQDHPEIEHVDLAIVQPRAFHPEGPIRRWQVDAQHIRDWAERVLFPAMDVAYLDHNLDAGKWCRFCPAKLVCPLMNGLFGGAMKASKANQVAFTDADLDRSYGYLPALKSYIAALEGEVFARLSRGTQMDNAKLVLKKANRVWRNGADTVLLANLGPAAKTQPELKSPAEIEKIGPEAKGLVKTWAYTPDSGFTVAHKDDKRQAVTVKTTQEIFSAAVKETSNG